MKRLLLTILITGIGFHSVLAQSKTFIKLNPTTLINELDVYVGHEMSPSITIEAGGGFIYTDYWDHVLNQFNFGQIRPTLTSSQYLNGRGYAARLGVRFYVISPYSTEIRSNARGTYFEPLLFYKQIWYPVRNKEVNSNNYAEKDQKYVSGLQLLIGRQYQSGKIYIDKYLGLGVRAKTYNFDNFEPSPTGVSNNGKRATSWLPSVQLGIKIAFDLSHH